MAVISLDLAPVACWASTNPLAALQALTMCNGPNSLLRQCERRRLLPSMATISSPNTSRNDPTHSRKRASKTSGDNTENTRPNVSCEGIPCGNSRNRRNHASFALPNAATCVQPSAPQITAVIAITIISISR